MLKLKLKVCRLSTDRASTCARGFFIEFSGFFSHFGIFFLQFSTILILEQNFCHKKLYFDELKLFKFFLGRTPSPSREIFFKFSAVFHDSRHLEGGDNLVYICNVGLPISALSKSLLPGIKIQEPKFFSKKVIFFGRHAPIFAFDLPLKIQLMKNFKIIVETLLIAHSIGNFILKNV